MSYQKLNSWMLTVLPAHLFARFAICSPNCYLSYHLQPHCCVMQVEVPLTPCPAQCLQMQTTAANNNERFNETSIVYFGTPETTVVINATGLRAGEHYHSNFSIKDHKDDVVGKGEESVPFSECKL